MRKFLPVLLYVFGLSFSVFAEKGELVRYTVMADGHPVTLWGKSVNDATEAVLLVHGRTWSALPDFNLHVPGENLSLMDGLVERGYAVYAIDMRGYGQTPRDETGWLTPNRAADDVAIVAAWIANERDWEIKPHLFGWSMGSTISQLTVQRYPDLFSSLTLFGYWRDVDVELPADKPGIVPLKLKNTAKAAASDFITPGSISKQAIDAFITAALKTDPIKVDIKSMDQYNELDESKITIPTLVMAGEFDPIAPKEIQAKLFTRIGTGHKLYVSVPGGDHAAFMESPRTYFLHELTTFLQGISLD